MRAEELRRMTRDELVAEIAKRKHEQMNLRFRQAQGDTEGLGNIRIARRAAARAMTVLNEKIRADDRE